MKVLIITPSWKILGGVANHYKGMVLPTHGEGMATSVLEAMVFG